MSAADRVREIAAAAVADPALVIDGVEVSAAGKRKLVRITLDRVPAAGPDGWSDAPTPALSLDEIADHSRAIGEALDRDEPFGGAAYVLEISSPGVGKPLREPRHYRRNVGRLLKVTSGGAETTGRIVRAGDESVVLAVEEPPAELALGYAAIDRACVAVEFTSNEEKDE